MKKLSLLALAATLLAAGAWTAVYLNRWEWTRALWTTMVFVAAEVGLVAVVLSRRIDRLAERLDEQPSPVERRLAETRPTPDRFAWLEQTVTRTNVFVTMMVGGGVLVSGLLWVVDKIAGRSVTSAREHRLAGQLDRLAYPSDGLVPDDAVLFAAELDRTRRTDLAMLLTGRPEESW